MDYIKNGNIDTFDKLIIAEIDNENKLREIFADPKNEKHDELCKDTTAGLIPVYDNLELFSQNNCANYKILSQQENMLFSKYQNNIVQTTGNYFINESDEFKRNFDVFTEHQLKLVDWNNIFVAGGSVLACLLPLPKNYKKTNGARRKYFHDIEFPDSDIDIFIYGIEDENKANEKMIKIVNEIKDFLPYSSIAIRGKHAITIVSQYPHRHIQFVVRLYKTKTEILAGFDVDCCSVGYDGTNVYMTPRAHYAIMRKCNTVDMTRRSPSYEMRLAKYGKRGFMVEVPNYEKYNVNPALFEKRLDKVQGLGKLIVLDKLGNQEAREECKEFNKKMRYRAPTKERTDIYEKLNRNHRKPFADEHADSRVTDEMNVSDYSLVFVPWGPTWKASDIIKLLKQKDKILNSKAYDPTKTWHTHPCFIGSIEDVIKDCCPDCIPPPADSADAKENTMYVSGSLTWLKLNPGQQRVGSFNPITEGDWTHEAYIPKDYEKSFRFILSDDALGVYRELENIKDDMKYEKRDYAGRTMLHLAAMSNSVKCCKYLLSCGARITNKTKDGRTALHIACQYGNLDIVKSIINFFTEKKKVGEEKKKNETNPTNETDNKQQPETKIKSDKDEVDANVTGDGSDEDETSDEDDEDDDDDDDYSIKNIINQKKEEQDKISKIEEIDCDEKKEDILDVNDHDWDYNLSPIHYAILYNHKEVFDYLIDLSNPFKVNVNKNVVIDLSTKLDFSDNKTIYQTLELTLLSKNYYMAARLIDKKAKTHETYLSCIKHNDLVMLKLLVRKGCVNVLKMIGDKSVLNYAIDHLKHKEAPQYDYDLINYLISLGVKTHITFEDLNLDKTQLVEATKKQSRYSSGSRYHNERNEFRHRVIQPLTQAITTLNYELATILVSKFTSKSLLNYINNTGQTFLDVTNKTKESYTTELNTLTIEAQRQLAQQLKTDITEKIESDLMDSKFLKEEFTYKNPLAEKFRENSKRRKGRLFGKRCAISKCRDSDSDSDNDDTGTGNKKRIEKIKSYLAILDKFIKLFSTNNSKIFKDMTSILPKEDMYLVKKEEKAEKQWRSNDYRDRKEKQEAKKVSFQILSEKIGKETIHGSTVYEDLNDKYSAFYDAVLCGDLDKMEELTINQKVGSQVIVCSHTHKYSQRTPLMYAVMNGSVQVFKKVLEIAEKQYTPIKLKTSVKKKNRTFRPSINNYDLTPGCELDKNILDEEVKDVGDVEDVKDVKAIGDVVKDETVTDPKKMVVNCIVKPATLIAATTSYYRGDNLLTYIIYHNSKEILEYLLSVIDKYDDKFIDKIYAKQRYGDSTMTEAIKLERVELFKLFDDYFVTKYGKLETTNPKEFVKVMNTIYKDNVNYACTNGYYNTLKFYCSDSLYANIANIDRTDLLYLAIQKDKVNIKSIKYLIETFPKTVNYQNENGLTPLHKAVSFEMTRTVEILLTNEAKIDIYDTAHNLSAYHLACYYGHDMILDIMFPIVKDVDVMTPLNQTGLMFAMASGKLEAVKALLNAGADVATWKRDIFGNTWLHYFCIGFKISYLKELEFDVPNELSTLENNYGLTPYDILMLSFRNSLGTTRADNEKASPHLVTVVDKTLFVSNIKRVTPVYKNVVDMTFRIAEHYQFINVSEKQINNPEKVIKSDVDEAMTSSNVYKPKNHSDSDAEDDLDSESRDYSYKQRKNVSNRNVINFSVIPFCISEINF